ncbi:MAG: hypothetical protein NZ988_03320 [Thaumarchaeota archaeon]|nr:hypothetical protein [Candidatus Calditenuaceae archaeon]MDW8187062.1 hypothetical protein [Nitrososphaerota archaeon]
MRTIRFERLIVASLTFAALLLMVQIAAGQGDASYYVYEYRVEHASRSSVSGRLSVSATEIGDGTIRLRAELTFNDGIATIEKDVPESAFVLPVLPRAISPGSFSYSRENYSVSVSVQEVGRAQREVGGRTYQTVSYSIYAVFRTTDDRQLVVSSSTEVIDPSRVIYSLSSSISTSSSEVKSLILRLADSNVDLASIRAPENAMSVEHLLLVPYAQEYIVAGGVITEPRLSNEKPAGVVANPSQNTNEQSLKLAIIGAAGLAVTAAAAVLTIKGVRKAQGTQGPTTKPHYV